MKSLNTNAATKTQFDQTVPFSDRRQDEEHPQVNPKNKDHLEGKNDNSMINR